MHFDHQRFRDSVSHFYNHSSEVSAPAPKESSPTRRPTVRLVDNDDDDGGDEDEDREEWNSESFGRFDSERTMG